MREGRKMRIGWRLRACLRARLCLRGAGRSCAALGLGLFLGLGPAGTGVGAAAWAATAEGELPVWTALAEEETSAGTASALQVQILQYADLEGRIKEQNPQVQMERISYESRIAAYEMARDDLEETRKHLRREASDREEEGDADGAAHYRSQAEALKQAVEDMDKQIRRASGSSQTLGLSRLEDTMLWTAQNLMGTYNTLKLDRMAAEAEADLAWSQYEQAQNQAALGAASSRTAQEAKAAAQAKANRAASLWEEMERTKAELLLLAGFSAEDSVEIGGMPVPDASRMDAMDWEADRRKALGNNYELREQRGGSFSGTNKQLHARQREISQSEETMYAGFAALYQDVLTSRSLQEAAAKGQVSGEAAWRTVSHQWELGMLSRQEYLEARHAYLQRAAEKGKADIRFQLAMDAYEWARQGLMR